jgi:hypothetical protein
LGRDSDTHNCLWRKLRAVTGRRSQQRAVVLVALGGFAGANLRYLAELVVPSSLVATATMIPEDGPQRTTFRRSLTESTNKNGSAPIPVASAVASPATDTTPSCASETIAI